LFLDFFLCCLLIQIVWLSPVSCFLLPLAYRLTILSLVLWTMFKSPIVSLFLWLDAFFYYLASSIT
jgi:hypothetical protein